jgi:hypothetical protein
LIKQAEREVSKVDAQFARIRADYVAGKLDADDWRSFRDELTEKRVAAEAEADQLRTRAAEVATDAAAFDVDTEAAERLAALREAVAGEVTGADGLVAVRAALARVFERITLVRDDDELLLVPQVRAFDEIEAWARLEDGRMAVKPRPQTLALPGKQLAREPSCSHPLFASALFEPIRLVRVSSQVDRRLSSASELTTDLAPQQGATQTGSAAGSSPTVTSGVSALPRRSDHVR